MVKGTREAVDLEGFGSRLGKLTAALRQTKKALAEKMGVTPSAFNFYGTRNLPETEKLARLAQATGVNLNWLLLGEGTMFALPQPESGLSVPGGQGAGKSAPIKIMDSPGALGSSQPDPEREAGVIRIPRSMIPEGAKVMAFYSADDSMAPIVGRGWIVGVELVQGDPCHSPERFHDRMVVVRLEGTAVVRWLHYTAEDWILTAENKKLEAKTRIRKIPRDKPLEVLGTVSWWFATQPSGGAS